jgi:hydroxypyruvate isomerase
MATLKFATDNTFYGVKHMFPTDRKLQELMEQSNRKMKEALANFKVKK